MTASNAVTIIGGGLSAVRTAQSLRSLGFDGTIHLYSEESEAPYDRPPLSKDFLSGDMAVEDLRLLTDKAAESLDLDVHLGAEAVALDRTQRIVSFADGSTAHYDRLVIATGARARQLPALVPSARVHYLRTVEDAQRLATALQSAASLIVVGSGFIGLEVASTAKHLNVDVEIVAADEGPMIGIVGQSLSQWIADLPTSRGIRMTHAVTLNDVDVRADSVKLTLGDGSTRSADLVVVGVGVHRDLDWLAQAGLPVANGLLCDDDGRTTDPFIYGAGDIVCVDGLERESIQHWTAAAESARRTAHTLMGKDHSKDQGDGFFWTEQHGHRIQFIGTAVADSILDVTSGSVESGKFAGTVLSSGTATGVFASNSPREFLKSRQAFQKSAQAASATRP